MATKNGTPTFVTNTDITTRFGGTYPYEVKENDFGFVELRRPTHAEVQELRTKHEDETGAIKDFSALLDDLFIRFCVTPSYTPETLASAPVSLRVIRTIGQHVGFQCGYLTTPPAQDLPKTPDAPDPTADTSAPSSAS